MVNIATINMLIEQIPIVRSLFVREELTMFSSYNRSSRTREHSGVELETIYKKCYKMNPTELYKLMEKVLPMVTTDLTNGQIMSYAAQLLPVLSDLDFDATARIPVDGSYRMVMINKMSVLLADMDDNRELLEEIMEP